MFFERFVKIVVDGVMVDFEYVFAVDHVFEHELVQDPVVDIIKKIIHFSSEIHGTDKVFVGFWSVVVIESEVIQDHELELAIQVV